MKIKKVSIKKFRGFEDVEFDLGGNITVIAGQNGTQKTTLLGVLTQTFSITKGKSPLYGEKPLCGGDFKSSFKEKFRLSETFDKHGEHEWTLSFDNRAPFTVESMSRGEKESPGEIRFWQKGKRGKGDGYIQYPVIFLSLKRLFPSGEDNRLDHDETITLSDEEQNFYKEWHNKILATFDDITETAFLHGRHKDTLGANTSHYDWRQNSAGQDNIGKIILAVLSFKRLQKKHNEDYQGGILAIDELDATLYPAAQEKLLKALRKFSSDYNIQIIFTTHSLPLMKKACALQKDESLKNQIKVIFLKKKDRRIVVENTVHYPAIENHLNITLNAPDARKLKVFTEDKETRLFARALLGTKITRHLKFVDCALGCGNLIDLASRKIPYFIFPHSIIILDGDIRLDKNQLKRANKLKNVIILPGKISPERMMANMLNVLSDNDEHWDEDNGYTKTYCFSDIRPEEIVKDRKKGKEWFNTHLKSKVWGQNASKLFNLWKSNNKEKAVEFVSEFKKLFNKFSDELRTDKL